MAPAHRRRHRRQGLDGAAVAQGFPRAAGFPLARICDDGARRRMVDTDTRGGAVMSNPSDYKPSFDLTGSVMLITGPARGLGRASTLACAAAGADIVLGLRDKASDGGLAAEVEQLGRK